MKYTKWYFITNYNKIRAAVKSKLGKSDHLYVYVPENKTFNGVYSEVLQ
jgi:hypothetical protein